MGGPTSNFGIDASIAAHGCALRVKMSALGLNQLASSRLAARTLRKATEAPVPWAKSAVPHAGQKPRRATEPLSPVVSNQRTSPLTVMAAFATMKPDANGAPLIRWQSRQ